MEQNHFSKTGKGSSKEYSGEVILKLAHWPQRRCRLKGFSIFSSDGHFVQRSGTILAILVEGHLKNISTKLCFEISLLALEGMSFYVFFYFQLLRPLCSAEWNNLSDVSPRNISVKLF